MYAGRFTLLKSDHFSQKAIAVQRTRHYASGTYRTIISRGAGVVSIPKNKIPYIRVYPYKNMPLIMPII